MPPAPPPPARERKSDAEKSADRRTERGQSGGSDGDEIIKIRPHAKRGEQADRFLEEVKIDTRKVSRLPAERRELAQLRVRKNGEFDAEAARNLRLPPARERLDERERRGDFARFARAGRGRELRLDEQFSLHRRGDVARQLNLHVSIQERGGWGRRITGFVNVGYRDRCFGGWYAGPSWIGDTCWYPRWSPWVDWCWWDHCPVVWDPRPVWCRPIICVPAPVWIWCEVPVWQPLPVVACGTWVDVPVVVCNDLDVQLLAVRFVDPGHPELGEGPRYRIWLRNNSPRPIPQPFNVTLLAANTEFAQAGLPQAGVRVSAFHPGETVSVDVRLPEEVNSMFTTQDGYIVPFQFLHVLVDSQNEVRERFEMNNGAVLPRGEILPVDPAAFVANPTCVSPGGVVTIAGEGFGPEPGQLIVQLGNLELQGEILGWYDLGIQVRMPLVAMTGPMQADLIVVRGDGAAANPVTVDMVP